MENIAKEALIRSISKNTDEKIVAVWNFNYHSHLALMLQVFLIKDLHF